MSMKRNDSENPNKEKIKFRDLNDKENERDQYGGVAVIIGI